MSLFINLKIYTYMLQCEADVNTIIIFPVSNITNLLNRNVTSLLQSKLTIHSGHIFINISAWADYCRRASKRPSFISEAIARPSLECRDPSRLRRTNIGIPFTSNLAHRASCKGKHKVNVVHLHLAMQSLI